MIDEAALGPDHLDVALVLDNLGIAHEELGEYEEAERMYERTLAIRTRALPADDPQLAVSHRNLAELQLLRGEHERALAGFERTVVLLEAAHGPDDLRLAKPIQRIGETLARLGRHEEALARLEQALELRTAAAAGPEQIAEGRFALAAALWDAPASAGGDRSRARELAEQAREHYLGRDEWARELSEVEQWLEDHPAGGI